MLEYINTSSITINCSVQKVWLALTNSDEVNKYLPHVKVVSDWEFGSSIVYTCYDKDGNVYEWNGKPMIWSGKIETMEINRNLGIDYTDQSQGVIKENYNLRSTNDNVTEVSFTQNLISQETADNFKRVTNIP